MTKKTVFSSVGKLRQFPHTQISFLEIFFFGIGNFLLYAETAVFPHRPNCIVNVPLLPERFFEEICLSDDVDGSLIVQNNASIGIFFVHRVDPFETFFYDW